MAYNNTFNKNYGFGGFSSGNVWAQQPQKPAYEMEVKRLNICTKSLTKSAAYVALYDSENESKWDVAKGEGERLVLELILNTIENAANYGKHVLLYVPDSMKCLFSGVAVDYTINKRRSTGELVDDSIVGLYSKVLDAWHSNYKNISLMRYKDQTKEYSTRCIEWSNKIFDDVECGRIEANGGQPVTPSPTISPLEAKKLELIEKAEAALEADNVAKYDKFMEMVDKLEKEEVEA